MAAVLRSPMAGLTDEELAVLRLEDGSVPFHEAVLELAEGLYEEGGQIEISNSEEDQKQGRNADGQKEDDIETTAHRKLLKFYKKYRQLRHQIFSSALFSFTFQSHSESLAFRGKLWHGSSWQQYTASRAQTQDLIAQICNLSLHSICAGRCNSFLLLRCAKSCDTLFFVRTKLHPEVESLSN